MTVSYHVVTWNRTWALCQSNKALHDWTTSPVHTLYYSKETVLSLHQTTGVLKQWTEKHKEFLQECHSGKRKWCHPKEDSVSISDHLKGCNWNPNNDGSMVATHLDLDCLDVHIFGPLLKLWSPFRTQRLTDMAVSLNLTASLPDVVTSNKTLFSAFYF